MQAWDKATYEWFGGLVIRQAPGRRAAASTACVMSDLPSFPLGDLIGEVRVFLTVFKFEHQKVLHHVSEFFQFGGMCGFTTYKEGEKPREDG